MTQSSSRNAATLTMPAITVRRIIARKVDRTATGASLFARRIDQRWLFVAVDRIGSSGDPRARWPVRTAPAMSKLAQRLASLFVYSTPHGRAIVCSFTGSYVAMYVPYAARQVFVDAMLAAELGASGPARRLLPYVVKASAPLTLRTRRGQGVALVDRMAERIAAEIGSS